MLLQQHGNKQCELNLLATCEQICNNLYLAFCSVYTWSEKFTHLALFTSEAEDDEERHFSMLKDIFDQQR